MVTGTLLLLSKTRVDQKCVHVSLAVAMKNKKNKRDTTTIPFMENEIFSISILEVLRSFPKEPIQNITGALGVPRWPCGGLECSYLQFMALIQIRARLHLNSVNVLQHL